MPDIWGARFRSRHVVATYMRRLYPQVISWMPPMSGTRSERVKIPLLIILSTGRQQSSSCYSFVCQTTPVNKLVDLGHNPAKTIVGIAISVAFNDTNGGATATPRFIWQRTRSEEKVRMPRARVESRYNFVGVCTRSFCRLSRLVGVAQTNSLIASSALI